MASILDVARKAKVSASTVSLVMNHRDRVSPETRQRVEGVIRELGYSGRSRRKGATSGKAKALHVAFIYTPRAVVDGSLSSYCRDLIAGVQSVFAGSDSTLSIIRGADHIHDDLMLRQQVEAGELDGLIVFKPNPQDGYLDWLARCGLPLVVINRPPEHGRFSCVTLDYYGGGRLAIEYLMRLGHRRIAVWPNMVGDGRWLYTEYRAGAVDALREGGLEPLPVQERSSSLDERQIVQFCDEALAGGATAMAGGDEVMIRCVRELAARGIETPTAMSVIGFDDTGYQTESGLALTSIGFDKKRMGRLAARMVQRLSVSKGLRWLAAAVGVCVSEGGTVAPVPKPDSGAKRGSSLRKKRTPRLR